MSRTATVHKVLIHIWVKLCVPRSIVDYDTESSALSCSELGLGTKYLWSIDVNIRYLGTKLKFRRVIAQNSVGTSVLVKQIPCQAFTNPGRIYNATSSYTSKYCDLLLGQCQSSREPMELPDRSRREKNLLLCAL